MPTPIVAKHFRGIAVIAFNQSRLLTESSAAIMTMRLQRGDTAYSLNYTAGLIRDQSFFEGREGGREGGGGGGGSD